MSKDPQTKQSRRELILQTAVAELVEHGIEGLRIETILEKSGSSFSSLYHHFGSRENLVTAALVALFRNPVDDDISLFIERSKEAQTLDQVVAELKSGLTNILEAQGTRFRQAQFRIIAAALDRPELKDELREGQQELAKRLVDHFKKLQTVGAIPLEAKPVEIAWYFLQMAMGLVISDMNPEDVTKEDRVSLVIKGFMGLLNARV